MKKELEQQLYDKYPSLFVQKDWPMSQTCMCWGIETNDGWYNLIDETCAKIIEIDINKQIQFTQVKEKFGGLRIYFDLIESDNDKICDQVFKIINEAENKSYTICEKCNQPGKPNDNGWIMTLCNKCRSKNE